MIHGSKMMFYDNLSFFLISASWQTEAVGTTSGCGHSIYSESISEQEKEQSSVVDMP